MSVLVNLRFVEEFQYQNPSRALEAVELPSLEMQQVAGELAEWEPFH